MPINRHLWAPVFVGHVLPEWTCPTCGKGRLIQPNGKLHNEERGRCRNLDENDPYYDRYPNRFIAFLRCNNAFECNEIVTVCGNSFGIGTFIPQFINPPLRAIDLPKKIPVSIHTQIQEASLLFWGSFESAANKIRQAVELLLDLLIPTNSSTNSPKYVSLHSKIVEFQKIDPINGDLLMAVKWIGNDGSHVGESDRDSVLDAFDMFELVTENLFGERVPSLIENAQEINKARKR